ncbi:hypothetical protein [Microbacterium sp. YJN-G]|uniref:hypothetical protein n=1 Tax=Microbacterium sp. YJN-G TaxID=2763257 RepID=UPI001D0C92BC|nr:hypothetical protein [Microbacterium sp. YJN-G]
MTDQKPTRREILRPLHLVGIALVCGIFATVVTLVSTGAFTERVNASISRGSYEGLTPIALGLVVGGISFIVTLLGLAMLMLAVDPADVTRTIDRPVLMDGDGPAPEKNDRPADAKDRPADGGDAASASGAPSAS